METQEKKKELNAYQLDLAEIKEHELLYLKFGKDPSVQKRWYFDLNGDPKDWESVWFFVNETEDEEERIYIVVSLAMFEIKQNKITNEMVDEIEYYYYEIFVDKTFDVDFRDKNAQKDCYADLKKCYDELKKRNLL